MKEKRKKMKRMKEEIKERREEGEKGRNEHDHLEGRLKNVTTLLLPAP